MNKEIRLIAKNVFPIEPLDEINPGPGQETITLKATNVLPVKMGFREGYIWDSMGGSHRSLTVADLDSITLGPQPTPDNEMIFKGSPSEFFDITIVEMNNREDEPSRTPLDTCPGVREKVCPACDLYDVHVGCMGVCV